MQFLHYLSHPSPDLAINVHHCWEPHHHPRGNTARRHQKSISVGWWYCEAHMVGLEMRPALPNGLCSSQCGRLMPCPPPRTHHPCAPDSLRRPFYTPELGELPPSSWALQQHPLSGPLWHSVTSPPAAGHFLTQAASALTSTASLPRRSTVQDAKGCRGDPWICWRAPRTLRDNTGVPGLETSKALPSFQEAGGVYGPQMDQSRI